MLHFHNSICLLLLFFCWGWEGIIVLIFWCKKRYLITCLTWMSLTIFLLHTFISQPRTWIMLTHFGPQQTKLSMPRWQPVSSHQLLVAFCGSLWEGICKYLISTALPQQQKRHTASVVMAWPGWICHVLPPGWRESTLIGMNGRWVAQVERNVIASRKGWSSRNCNNSLHTCN